MWSIVQYKKIGKGIASELNPQLAGRESCGNGDGSRTASPRSRVPETSSRNSDPEQRGSDGADPEKENESGKFYVTLDSDNDPLNPRDWPLLQRAKTVLILSILVFVQAWAGACDSLENAKASEQYHVSPVAQDLTTAMYLFGIGSGCLFVGPLSQDLGRNPVYLGFSFVYLLFTFGNAMSKSFGSQIVCRYLAGVASSAALGINGASMGDMFNPVELTLWFPLMAWVNVVRKYKVCNSTNGFSVVDL
jgi:DHA1 family multidrug resistance protein-like MFS transporter